MPRPWISANLAVSADGKITSIDHTPSGWTSREDHARLIKLRINADALLVGRRTLIADQMSLTVPGQTIQPLRCIVSASGEIPDNHPIFLKPGGPVHILVCGEKNPPPHSLLTYHHGNLADFLTTLRTNLRVNRLHCEGGGSLIRSLAELDAIDELHLTLAGHTLFGGQNAPSLTGIPNAFLPHSLNFEITHFEPRNESGECFLTYRRRGKRP
ncbi:MAG: RibD family protein [Gloeobacteraceae cyanobacterium ES-bin-144]|nr:RibD family protein [Verrucomicrobiales bacterium]